MAKKRVKNESELVELVQEESEPTFDEIDEAFEDLTATSEDE